MEIRKITVIFIKDERLVGSMAKYEIAYWGNVFDDLIADFAPIDAMEYFREKYGGVRLIKDGVML